MASEEEEIKKLGAIINQFRKDKPLKEITEEEIADLEKELPLDFIEDKINKPIEPFETTKIREINEEKSPEENKDLSDLEQDNSNEEIPDLPSLDNLPSAEENAALLDLEKDNSPEKELNVEPLDNQDNFSKAEEKQSEDDSTTEDDILDEKAEDSVQNEESIPSNSSEDFTNEEDDFLLEEEAELEKEVSSEVAKDNILSIPILAEENDFEPARKPEIEQKEQLEKLEELVASPSSGLNKEDLLESSEEIDNEINQLVPLEKSLLQEEEQELLREEADEQELDFSSIPTSDEEKKDRYKKALKKIESFSLKNKKIFYDAFYFDAFAEDELEKIIDEILADKNENSIAEKISKRQINKSIFEVSERREKLLNQEQKIFSEFFKERKYFLFIRQLVYLVILVVSLFSFYFFTRDYIKSYRLYALAEKNIEGNNFVKGEEYFFDAFSLKPNIVKTREIAELYEKKQEFLRAEEKFKLALSLNKNDFATLLSYGDFFFRQKRYAEAEVVYRQYLENTSDFSLSEIIDESQVVFLERLGVNYIKWGEEDPNQFTKAKDIYDNLHQKNPDKKLFYYAKLLQINALTKNYNEAKAFYLFIQNDEASAGEKIFLEPYLDYLDFLNETFKNYQSLEYLEFVQKNLSEENEYLVSSITTILELLESAYPDNSRVFLEAAKWEKNTGNDNKAVALALKSLRLYEEDPFTNPIPDELFSFLGELSYENKSFLEAVDFFENALDYNPSNPLANYYLGKINALEPDNYQASLAFFERALNNWQEVKNGPQHLDILYNLGYLNFLLGKEKIDSQTEFQDNFTKALDYWTDLSENISKDKDYLVDYGLSLAYLHLEKYDLAEATLLLHLEELENNYTIYQSRKEGPGPLTDLENRLYVLSDIYNNLAVVNLKKALDNNQIISRKDFQDSLNYFINAISIKDKLGLLTTIPSSNFNAINNRTLNSDLKDYFQIAESFLPNSLL